MAEPNQWLAYARAMLEGALEASPLGAAERAGVVASLVAQEDALAAVLRERTRASAPTTPLDPDLGARLRGLAASAWQGLDERSRDDLVREARALKRDGERARILGAKLLGALLRGTGLVQPIMHAARFVGGTTQRPTYHRGAPRRRGSHWTLYEARPASGGDLVALWIFDPAASQHLRDPAHRAELDRLLAVRAPQVVPLRGVIELPGGSLGVVGDLLWSPPLADLLKKGSVRPVTRALGMTLDLVEAVRALRAAGVHPVLDPELVLATADASARLLLEPAVQVVNLNHAGLTSPGPWRVAWLPPERIGDALDARPSGDVYELGALLHEALLGRPPFSGKTNREVIMQVLQGPPAPLPDDVPASLRAVVERALAKRPEDRHPDLERFAGALRQVRGELEGGTVPIPVPPRVRPAPPPLGLGPAPTAPALVPGVRLGRYTLARVLGRGSAGTVFLARDAGGLEVAVKVLDDVGGSVEAFARFEREQRLLATLTLEEGFVPFLDAGQSLHGPFVVMPFLPGGTLRARLDAGLLSIPEALAVAAALARALAAAHGAGVVHRDLKPENVLFTADGRPLLADLGVAKHFSADPAEVSGSFATSRGLVRGTFGYMPLEQMEDSSAVGPAADVFAWGAVAYELLAGRRAFPARGAAGVMQAVQRGVVDPLATARPDAPPAFVAIVERALARDPAARFADGRALVAALERGR